MKKIEKILLTKKSETKLKEKKGFKVLDIGFLKNIKAGCGSHDNDNMCSSWCPKYSCQHDGVCGSGYWDM